MRTFSAALVLFVVVIPPVKLVCGALAVDSSGDLFSEPLNSNEIDKFLPDGIKKKFAVGTPDAPLNGPIAVDSGGSVYACAAFTTILKYAPDGTKTVFATDIGKTWPDALAFDANGNLFVSASDAIIKITPDGKKAEFATGVHAYAFVFDQSGNLFVADNHGENGKLVSAIVKFTPDGKKSAVSGDSGYALAFDKSGNLFVATSNGILKFAPDGKKSVFSQVDAAEGLIIDSSGNFIGDSNETLFKVSAADGKRSVFKWKSAPDGEEEQGEDSADKLPPNYAKHYLVAQSTLSPDKKFAVIYPALDDSEFPEGKNYLVALKPFSILTKLETKRPYYKNESNCSLAADWSDDGSVALITLDAKWGPGDVFLVEIKNGKVTRTTNILAKAHALLVPEFKKSKAEQYSDYTDFIFITEESSGFELDGSKTIRVNASATTDPKGVDDGRVWDGHVLAVWDIPQGKFTSQKPATEFSGVRKHDEDPK